MEIRLPWQLLNFSNPSQMQIHDDYYENYGVEGISIDRMYVGAGDGSATVPLFEAALEGWGTHVTYHERLKESYYVLQRLWADGVSPRELWDVGGQDAGSGQYASATAVAKGDQS